MARYVAALTRQLRLMAQGAWVPHASWAERASQLPLCASAQRTDLVGPLQQTDLPYTVFLGGGTPTALPIELFAQVMEAVAEVVPLEQAEVTSEANPGTVLDHTYLREMRQLGVNRLSMGVQTLNDRMLKVLGRIHSAAQARASYEAARAAGFDNINLDFIFGLPSQTVIEWEQALHEIVRWEVDHFALYSLIVEPGTPLATQVAAGRVVVPNDDITGEMYEQALAILGAAGYVQYEISNWARPAQAGLDPLTSVPAAASRHNIAYWLDADYLGCGAGAHSHSRRLRWADELVLEHFVAAVEAGKPPVTSLTELDTKDVAAETMMMGLRLNSGVGEQHFLQQTGHTLDQLYADTIVELVELGLLERTAQALRLSARGRMVGNSVFARFL